MNKSILASSQWLDGKIQGKSVKYSQIAQVTRSSSTIHGLTFTRDNEKITIVGTTQQNESLVLGTCDVIQNHKYLKYVDILSGSIGNSDAYIKIVKDVYGSDNKKIITADTTQSGTFQLATLTNITINVSLKVQLIDLTDIFGAGNEPTTLADFYATDLGKVVQSGKYLPYGNGILNATAPYVFKDANDNTLATYSRTSKVDLGGLDWNNAHEYGKTNCQSQLTDAKGGVDKGFSINYNYDVQATYNPPTNKTVFIHPSNKLIYICDSAFIGKTGAEVKALLSGVYLEYEPATQLELRSAGTIKDTLSNCDGKVVRKVGSVDLGSVYWCYDVEYKVFSSAVMDRKIYNYYENVNAICSKYPVQPRARITQEVQEGHLMVNHTNKTIRIKDSNYTDEATFNASLNGVNLIYELATPTTEQHASLAIPKLATKCTDANGMGIDIERNN